MSWSYYTGFSRSGKPNRQKKGRSMLHPYKDLGCLTPLSGMARLIIKRLVPTKNRSSKDMENYPFPSVRPAESPAQPG